MLDLTHADRRVMQLSGADDVAAWRAQVRELLNEDVHPDQVEWHVANSQQNDLFAGESSSMGISPAPGCHLLVARQFLDVLQSAMLHNDPGRFALGYRIMWRCREEPNLPGVTADPDIVALHRLAKSVRRDIHKMHAFVRFRKIGSHKDGREIYVAWFEPDHHIVRTVGPFFRDRFTGMDWLIVTPTARIGWDGANLLLGPGGSRADVPGEDVVEEEWRQYYSSIFNPARVKPKAMKSEMPVKYWKNLPEAELIAPLLREADSRVRAMIEASRGASPVASVIPHDIDPEDKPAIFASLAELNQFAGEHDERISESFSPKIVFGEGAASASLMIVGEQPGDREDEEGRPFVGPAGQLLTQAMTDAGIDRQSVYLTNAVKRFKYELRGKRRIHGTPSQTEINHYRWWLMEEIALVKPRVIVPLGSSAIFALLGKREKLAILAGQRIKLESGPDMIAAYHPSYILRLPDEEGRKIEYQKLARHLALAHAAATE